MTITTSTASSTSAIPRSSAGAEADCQPGTRRTGFSQRRSFSNGAKASFTGMAKPWAVTTIDCSWS